MLFFLLRVILGSLPKCMRAICSLIVIVRDSIEKVKIMCLFFLKVPLESDKNVPYISFTSPTCFNKKFSELNYNYFTISS